MSELVVFKANELAVSRYDLTEHETKLILCGVALLNPTENPTEEQRTVTFTYQQYAQMMGISRENAYKALVKSARDLMTRTVEVKDPLVKGFEIFQWVNYARFTSEHLMLIFSPHIVPYLFHLKKFIKYNLEHVKAFENKYSMRVYEWLLKELMQRKTHKANIEINIADFKFMLMLENNYPEFKHLKYRVLEPVTKDLNTYSNMRLNIDKRGRPADTLIFQVELDKQIDLVTELAKEPASTPEKTAIQTTPDNHLHSGLKKTLQQAAMAQINLTAFEDNFLNDMKEKYNLNGSFLWLSAKQKTTLQNILAKYRNI